MSISLPYKMRLALKRKILFVTIFAVIVIIFTFREMRAMRPYDYILKENIIATLHEKLAVNFTSAATSECDYNAMVLDETSLSAGLVDGDLVEGHRIRDGGEYAPIECKPKYSTAIIVPYRDRAEELRGFLVYMHNFLRHQQIHYRIYVIEQVDTRPFNRAKLLNIGAKTAMNSGYPCLVLHDVDLLPLKPANLYVCTELPRHMSSNINKFRLFPYQNQFGGAIAITSAQYKAINGMSNQYFGYGAENEDLYLRLESKELRVCRFDPEIGRYHSLEHSTQRTDESTYQLLSDAKQRITTDGLSSLQYTEVATVMHPLFTHIMVDL